MKINEETLKELLAIARITDYDLSLKAVFDVAYDLYYENNFDDKKTNDFFSKADNLGTRTLNGEKMFEKKTIKLSADKISNELSDVDLFILLKGMIKQNEVGKALKLVSILEDRLNEVWVENAIIKDVIRGNDNNED